MNKLIKIASAIILFSIPYLITFPIFCWFKYSLTPNLSFSLHRDVLGATVSSYSSALIAVLIVGLTFLLGIKNNNFIKLQQYGYMLPIITLYALTFVELGILFFAGIILISNFKELPLPSMAAIMVVTSFMHLCLLILQLYNLSNRK
ncbi:MAG TPA: biopolymer transporter ExbB [Arsenophonus apicola]|uniref:biopolymer transporter ExbB n=1 Tax=Arsenophonus apicola TaxID=2879119 RepID=UPI001CDC2C66|nr:biopolymer transporter ExbB [Arsenophonus apicola]UBX28499.1 biopolymer transporter ExbB [Arsenophonus apicola]